MKYKQKILSLLLASFLLAGSAFSESDLSIYPIKGLFIGKDVRSEEFKNFTKNNQNALVNDFALKISKYFTNSVNEINEKSKYNTFGVYMNVPRASRYEVNKLGALLDVYLPLTMSINFVNLATGETVYTYPQTNYTKLELNANVEKNMLDKQVYNSFSTNYEKLEDEIIQKASTEFKPFNITAKVSDKYKQYYVLDKGLDSGIAKGDLLSDKDSNQISIVYSDLNYAVAIKLVGEVKTGAEFSKFSNTNLSQLKKPKVLFMNDIGSESLYNIFSGALGNNANFNLISVDRIFYDMQTTVVGLNDNFRSKNSYNRIAPDYFLKLYMTLPSYSKFVSSNQDYMNIDKYVQTACAVIYDNSGRIVYSVCDNDELINKVVSDIKLDEAANFEILAKNLLYKLAKNIQDNIQFKNVKFKILKSDETSVTIADKDGYLKYGTLLTAYRKVSTQNKVPILIPIAQYKVKTSQNGIVMCAMSKKFVDDIKYPTSSDIIQYDVITKSASKNNVIEYLPEDIELPGNEVKLRNFKNIAFAALSSSISAPIAMNRADYEAQITELNSLGFRRKINIENKTDNTTIKVVYKINLKNKSVQDKTENYTYEIIVGLVKKNNDDIVKKEAISQEVSFSIPKDFATTIGKQNAINNELYKFIYPLVQKVAIKF